MRWAVSIAVFFAVAAVYANWLRPYMRDAAKLDPSSRSAKFLDWIEPVERIAFWKSETIFMARVKMVTGFLLTAATQAGGIDITPLMPFIPDQYEGIITFVWNLMPLIVSAVGWFDQQQRFDTTKPVEIVAMRTDAPEAVKEAAAVADATNKETVEVIKQAGAV